MPNHEDFSERMRQATSEIERITFENVNRIAIFLNSQILLNTPVDEGTARANWFIRLNEPSVRVRPSPQFPVDATQRIQERQRASLEQTNITARITSIHITNNLPYILRLDRNYSPQTRGRGIVAPAIEETVRFAGTL